MLIEIERDQLAEVIEVVRTQLRQAGGEVEVKFSADTKLVEGYRAEARIRQFTLMIDEPLSLGGTDQGPNPVELVLAALGTCQEIVYATYARILGIPIESVSVSVEGSLDPRGFFGVADVPAGFNQVSFAVDIRSVASLREISHLIATANAHCPVLDILRQPVPVTGSYSHNGSLVAFQGHN
jgi:putative redox protein